MCSEIFFRQAAEAIKKNGRFSQYDNSWTIGVHHIRTIFDDLLKNEAQESPRPYASVLKEGEQKGYWTVNYDHDYVADLVVIRPLVDGERQHAP